MSELIDRQAALDALRRCQTYLYDARDPELKIELSSADAAIKELPTIQPVATDTNVGNNSEIPNSSDAVSRQAAIDALDCINGTEEVLRSLPPARPEPTDINAKEAVYNLAEKIGIHQLFALTVELRGEPIQPEPQEGHWIRRDCGLDVECKCSVCGYKDFVEPHDTYWFKRNYCPKCGTKMKGERQK